MANYASRYIIIGPMAAGKSTVGQLLAEKLQYQFIDLDKDIEARTGVDIPWIFDLEGEHGFRERETESLKAYCEQDNIVIATGGGIIMRPENHEFLKLGTTIYLSVSIKKQLQRTKQCKSRPLLKVDDPKAKLEELAKVRNPIYEKLADYTFPNEHASIQLYADHIYESIVL